MPENLDSLLHKVLGAPEPRPPWLQRQGVSLPCSLTTGFTWKPEHERGRIRAQVAAWAAIDPRLQIAARMSLSSSHIVLKMQQSGSGGTGFACAS